MEIPAMVILIIFRDHTGTYLVAESNLTFMKKILFVITGLFLLQVGVAQSITKPVDKKSSLMFSAGPSFPLGSFGSSTADNAGMAKLGYNIDASYIYQFNSLGLVFHGMYVNHNTKLAEEFSGLGIGMGHWNYTVVDAGIMNSFPVGDKGSFDLRVLAGAAFVNSPHFHVPGETGIITIPSINSTTFVSELGAGYRHMLNGSAFIHGGLDWIYMKPTFKAPEFGPEPMEQKIAAFNVHIGAGFRF